MLFVVLALFIMWEVMQITFHIDRIFELRRQLKEGVAAPAQPPYQAAVVIVKCYTCGQYVDLQNGSAVLHHQQPGHKPEVLH